MIGSYVAKASLLRNSGRRRQIGGSAGRCQAAVIAALQATVDALSASYSSADPTTWTCSRTNQGTGQCNPAADDIHFSAVGVESVPDIPWINRPTFQQVVQFPGGRSS